MKYGYIITIILALLISCKSAERTVSINNNVNFNEGWVNENKFIATSIGYPNGYAVTKDEMETSAFNAALALSKVKIENAFAKELPNKKYENDELKNIIEKYIKVEYSSFVDDRYCQIKTTVEYNNLLGLLRNGNIKKMLN
ncbi:hypothetical protein BRSU_1511 [Brachyspira suanatina]|uniref:Lipoprotein n=1 Tax=Brachyspira suanatina TaxID=381802 RepID=A0A0G4K868_9SPIR|nr:hypothetical protein [Brachyspira suanatina]CRF33544.1 hypothetical protein BRSU_1511 [Brachyspira suanatina]